MSALFHGLWDLDGAASVVWNSDSRSYVPDEVGRETIRLDIADGVQDYEVLYGDDPTIRMGYTARYDDVEWAPYVVREIIESAAGSGESVAAFRRRIKADQGEGQRRFELGANYGNVRIVSVDDRTHYRISRNDDHSPQSCLLRRLAADGSSFTASLMDAEGIVFRTRVFHRTG
jgi:hypothetical protein